MEQYPNIHEKLIEGCRKGDRKAQFEIYKLYYKAMYNTSLRIVNDSMEAEDIMQESFLSAFKKMDNYRGEVSFGAWLKRIVVNNSIDSIRRRKDELSFSTDDEIQVADESGLAIDWEDEAKEKEMMVKRVKNAINQLPDGYRVILSLYLLEGYDHEEISEVLGISGSTSRSQFTRAKRKLLETLNIANEQKQIQNERFGELYQGK